MVRTRSLKRRENGSSGSSPAKESNPSFKPNSSGTKKGRKRLVTETNSSALSPLPTLSPLPGPSRGLCPDGGSGGGGGGGGGLVGGCSANGRFFSASPSLEVSHLAPRRRVSQSATQDPPEPVHLHPNHLGPTPPSPPHPPPGHQQQTDGAAVHHQHHQDQTASFVEELLGGMDMEGEEEDEEEQMNLTPGGAGGGGGGSLHPVNTHPLAPPPLSSPSPALTPPALPHPHQHNQNTEGGGVIVSLSGSILPSSQGSSSSLGPGHPPLAGPPPPSSSSSSSSSSASHLAPESHATGPEAAPGYSQQNLIGSAHGARGEEGCGEGSSAVAAGIPLDSPTADTGAAGVGARGTGGGGHGTLAADLVIFGTRESGVQAAGEECRESSSILLPDDMKQSLECPVCARIALPPVMQCRNGHVTCNPCRLKVQSCPMCREIDIDIRNLFAEKAVTYMSIPCEYRSYGCRVEVQFKEKELHERVCKFRPYICPYIECDHKLASDSVVMHVSTAHREECRRSDGPEITASMILIGSYFGGDGAWSPRVITCFGRTFFDVALTRDRWLHHWVWLLGEEEEAAHFLYEITAFKGNTKYVYGSEVASLRTSDDEIVSEGKCLSISDAIGRRLRDGDKIRYKLKLIRK